MRAIFSILGLLVVIAIIGLLARKQLGAVSELSIKPQNDPQVSVPTTTPGATAQQQSQQIQQQIKQSVEASMQQVRPVPDEK